ALLGLDRIRQRQIVLGVACHHTGFAARAAIQIDSHSPAVFHYLRPHGPASRSTAANCTKPPPDPTRATRTRVAPSASAPVDSSHADARIEMGFAPRFDAYL